MTPKAARDVGGESLKIGAFQLRTPIDPPAEVAVGEWLPPLRGGKERVHEPREWICK